MSDKPTDDRCYIGAAMKHLRTKRSWSQRDFADVTRMSITTVNHIECATAGLQFRSLEIIAKTLDKTIPDLINLGKKLKMAEKPKLREVYAANLKRRRIERGMSQQELASKAGVSMTHVWKMENAKNNAGLDNIESIAIALEISASDLIKDFT